jgi:hypothetical protein
MCTMSVSGEESGKYVNLTTHVHLVLRLGMSHAVPPLHNMPAKRAKGQTFNSGTIGTAFVID